MKYLLLLLLSFNVYGAELIIEQGNSNAWFSDAYAYTPTKYTAVALRFGGDRFVELSQGGWTGVNHANFSGLSLGLRTQGKYFAETAFGAAHLYKAETTQLDGENQFLITLGIGGRFDNLFVTARLRHFSNGNTKGKNNGFDVFVGSLGVEF